MTQEIKTNSFVISGGEQVGKDTAQRQKVYLRDWLQCSQTPSTSNVASPSTGGEESTSSPSPLPCKHSHLTCSNQQVAVWTVFRRIDRQARKLRLEWPKTDKYSTIRATYYTSLPSTILHYVYLIWLAARTGSQRGSRDEPDKHYITRCPHTTQLICIVESRSLVIFIQRNYRLTCLLSLLLERLSSGKHWSDTRTQLLETKERLRY